MLVALDRPGRSSEGVTQEGELESQFWKRFCRLGGLGFATRCCVLFVSVFGLVSGYAREVAHQVE